MRLVARHQARSIRNAILAGIAEHGIYFRPSELSGLFGVTRQAVHRHVQQLVRENLVNSFGSGRNTKYELVPLEERHDQIPLGKHVAEHEVFDNLVKPILGWVDAAAADICSYGFTEMVNNAIDHSEGKQLRVGATRTAGSVTLEVHDDGIGIFAKIANALRLTDPRQSLLELAKGKFTTDPAHHTGEGIFFTSRVFDRFGIVSGELYFSHNILHDDWLLEDERRKIAGTHIYMTVLLPARRRLEDVFKQFSSGPEDYSFARTHVPVRLARYGDDHLVSRSQAKRVLGRFDRFSEVMLDFDGVRSIGQAFADEIFRVFANQNPQVRLSVVNDNAQVRAMIKRARSNASDQ